MPPRSAASRLPFWPWVVLPLLAAAWLRLNHLADPAPFVDEGGNVMAALDARTRTMMDILGEGRPALAWLFRPAGWFPAHLLLVARLMTAATGVATTLLLGWTLHRLAGRAAALAGMWLWAVLPIAVFHERLALQDPFLATFLAGAVLAMTTGSLGAPARRAWWFLLAGVLFGVAVLFKISAVFALVWLGTLYLALQRQQARPVFDPALAFIALGAVLPLLTLGTDLPRLGAHTTAPFSSLPDFSAPDYWLSTWQRTLTWAHWYAGYGRWPLALLLVGALTLLLVIRNKPRLFGACALGTGLAFATTALFYNRTFARYLMPDLVPLVLFLGLAGGIALTLPGRYYRACASGLLLVALLGWGRAAQIIGTNPEQAPVPPDEIVQYFTGRWSGRGVAELRDFLTAYARRKNTSCLVLTHPFTRPGCYGLMFAERADGAIGVIPAMIYEPAELTARLPALRQVAAKAPTAFFLLYEGSMYPPPAWLNQPGSNFLRVLEVPRGAGESFILYQFEP